MSNPRVCRLLILAVPVGLLSAMGQDCDCDLGPSLEELLSERTIQVEPRDLLFCCDPAKPFPQSVGRFLITNDSNVALRWFSAPCSDPPCTFPTFSPTSGDIPPGSRRFVEVTIPECGDSFVTFGLSSIQPRSTSQTIMIFDDCPTVASARSLGQFFKEPDAVVGTISFTGRDNLTQLSLTNGEQRQPENSQDIVGIGRYRLNLDNPKLMQLFGNTDFPCGAGVNGLTICPSMSAPQVAGDYLLVFSLLDGPIPLNDPNRFYQYAFVFDADGNADNNFVPLVEFLNDFFGGTDRWYEATYSPTDGWQLKVTDARNNNLQEVASAARIIIKDNVMLLVVPASEFEVADPPHRVTAFCHEGDFGLQGGFWSGDLDPIIGEPLAVFAPAQAP